MIRIILAFILALGLIALIIVLSRNEVLNPTLNPHLDYRKVLPPP